jgi:serine/threonine protein kinase
VTEQAERPRPADPLRLATPRIDDVEARRARASVASRLFGGPREPVRVGRYQVLGRIGTGGMGVVYRAHDPELARDVAVKLMNAEAIGDDQTATARARLVREARAMARLAHPNVIHVYDVGAVEDGVFIAMELVEGESLASWLRTADGGAPRDWREVLRVYIDAGRGLSAAHAAGIVHRDFKPENVLVGSDGRVRVGDFGLAGTPTLGDAESAEDHRPGEADLDDGLAGSLTRTGALLGTPKYMAPEQEHGALASARSDQFSFCVALYEGLYGRPPYDGDTVARYRRNVRAGRVVGPGIDTKVRGWIYTEIVRGLAVDPAARHPGMDALLDRLEKALVDPRLATRSWVRRVAVSVPLLGVAVGIGAWVGAQRSEDGVDAPQVSVVEPMDDAASPVRERDETRPVPATSPGPAPAVSTPARSVLAPAPKPAPTPTDAGRDPGEGSRVAERPAAKARRQHCFFQEDDRTKIATRGAKATLVEDAQGQCHRCRPEKRKAFLATLTADEDCAHKYTCAREPQSSCDAPSPG